MLCVLVLTTGAIQTLCAGGLFERARQLAGNSAQLLQLIEQQHTQHLVANNDAEELASRGNAHAAVEMFAAQGNWKRAHELVSGVLEGCCRPCWRRCYCCAMYAVPTKARLQGRPSQKGVPAVGLLAC